MKTRTAGKLNTYPSKLENGAVGGLRIAGWELAKLAAMLSPVDTGLLQSSSTYSEPEPRGPMHWLNRVGPTVYYGKFQELGTVKMKAQPFLKPATDELRTMLVYIIAKSTIRGAATMD